MKKEEARKIIEKSEDLVEISRDEWEEGEGEGILNCEKEECIFFKVKEKFPIVFEDGDRKVELLCGGDLVIIDKIQNERIVFYDSLPLLEKAIEKSKELRGRK